MSINSSNHIRKGNSNIKSIKKADFSVGIKGISDYGPTDLTEYFNGIVPPVGGYTIYVDKTEQGPSIHVPKDDNECLYYLKKYGATGTTINDALVWAKHQSNLFVLFTFIYI